MRKFKKQIFHGNCNDKCKEHWIFSAKRTFEHIIDEARSGKLQEENIDYLADELKFIAKQISKSESYPEGTENELLKLYDIFKNAILISGALQQPGHYTSSESAKQAKKNIKAMNKELKDNIKDIVVSLTDERIIF